MSKTLSICVYCGSRTGNNPILAEKAIELGRLMARHNIQLIYGGARIGIMGGIASSIMEHNGKAIGIIPHHLDETEVANRGISELHIVDDMHIRKRLMSEKADAFIIMPGGLGTLDETFEMLTWKQLGLHNKPIIFYNMLQFWDPLLKLIHYIVDNGFAEKSTFSFYEVADNINDIMKIIQSHFPFIEL
ncbi:MAG: TIGR00730 family Rossman fold protein [Alphaproteobacteria bacterium]|nr:TIGR00730 family Rossman fold protein [Alphaproteobacteria bacterium]